MALRSYAAVNLCDRDVAVLRSIMNLLEASGDAWEEVGAEDAQVVFLGMDDAGAKAVWESVTAPVRVWCAHEIPADVDYALPLPVKLKGVRPLVDRVQKELEAAPATAFSAGADDESAATQRDPFTHVRGF